MVRQVTVVPERGVDSYPLSPMQLGMLFHSLDGAAPGVDVEQVICELHESVNPAHFERAWREVMSRHAILRTGFELVEGGEPRQVVHAPSRGLLRFCYEEFGSEHEARHGLEEYIAADRRLGFPTPEAPLFRVALLRGGRAHYWFVTTFHHLLLDGRALVVMFKEALDLHEAFVQRRPLVLPAPRPYRLYIEWLQTLDMARTERFWREHLKGFSAPTLLPITRPAVDEAMDAPAARGELAFRLSERTTSALRGAACQHEVTVNTLLQAAWAIVLARYTGEDDVVFGAVRACRYIPVDGVNSIVGLFINTVPVRVRIAPDAALGPWLRDLREQWLALREFEHTPLMKAQQWSAVPAGQPLFETLFNYQEPSWDTALRQLGGKWEHRHFDIRSQPNYPLAVDAYGGGAILVKMLYDRRRFPDDAIARLLGHYHVVLEALAAAAVERVSAIPLLTAREREQVLLAWNRTAADYPRDACVHAMVESHAASAPDRIAIADTSTRLTYGELNGRANRIARRLRAYGIGPGALVPVCMDRSAEMIVAWLGVLKAGGAFVPLDPGSPRERLAFQLRDCGATVWLTQSRHRGALPEADAGTVVLEIAADGSGFELEPETNPPAGAAPRNLAYVIYTSGSTGQPKGVQIEHRSLMNLVTWHNRAYAITSSDRAAHVASPAFDASVWEIWPYLAAGASVHVPDEETRLSPAQLWRWMAETAITVAFLPTPLVEVAMDEARPAAMSLRVLLTGGDTLKRRPPPDLGCPLVNHYGPTENTVVATCGRVGPRGPDTSAPAIGRPIANTRVYVLDSLLRPVPVGVPGELYIAGDSLARGYLHRPGITRDTFVQDPFTAELSQERCPPLDDIDREPRMYRTGDRVRWTADGELEFLGRLDGQVKIRGCRIELGEIEAALQRNASVRESLVIARPDLAGHHQIVAYAIPRARAGHDAAAELAAYLRTTLPSYMIPAAFVFLDQWPLTLNGKIDRHALPEPAVRGAEADGTFAEPCSPAEQAIVRIWSEILGRPRIGRHDNFFDLGGHSLLAAQVVSRLNAALQAAFSVRTIFDHPSVAALARELDSRRASDPGSRAATHRLKRRTARPALEVLQST